jgi:hypothetical protein
MSQVPLPFLSDYDHDLPGWLTDQLRRLADELTVPAVRQVTATLVQTAQWDPGRSSVGRSQSAAGAPAQPSGTQVGRRPSPSHLGAGSTLRPPRATAARLALSSGDRECGVS